VYGHAPFEVKVESDGRSVKLEMIEQYRYEAGRLEGYPTKESNARSVNYALQSAGERWGTPVFLVPPAEELIPYHDDRPYPFGTPARLPSVCCRGYFRSLAPLVGTNRDRDGFFVSSLTIVWLQEQWAMPIEDSIVDAMKAIDWAGNAHEWEL
jgi:hypothetical protein